MSDRRSAAELLVIAYLIGGAESGSVDWSDVDLAHEKALEEVSNKELLELKKEFGGEDDL